MLFMNSLKLLVCCVFFWVEKHLFHSLNNLQYFYSESLNGSVEIRSYPT